MAAPTQFITLRLADLSDTRIPDGVYAGNGVSIEIGTLEESVLVSTPLTEGDPVFLVGAPEYLPAEIATLVTATNEANVLPDQAFTIAAPTYGAGTYTVTTAELSDGIEFIFPATIESNNGTAAGSTLSLVNHAVYVYTGPAPTPGYNWQSNGLDIGGATDPGSFDTTGRAGETIRLRTTVRGVDSFSDAITLAAAGLSDPNTLGSKLVHWFDFTDPSTMYQNHDRTNPVSANGQIIEAIDDKASGSSSYLFEGDFTGSHSWNATDGQMDCASPAANHMQIDAVPAGLSSTMEMHIAWKMPDNTQAGLVSVPGFSFYAGAANAGDEASPHIVPSGTPIYSTNNVDLVSPTRGDLEASWATGTGLVASARNMDMSGVSNNYYLLWAQGRGYRFEGSVTHIVMTEALTAQERSELYDWLAADLPA